MIQQTGGQDVASPSGPPEIFKRLDARMKMMKNMHRRRQEVQSKTLQSQTDEEGDDMNFIFNLPPDFFITDADFYDFAGSFAPSTVM
jgi:hypothetical protein